MAENDVLLLLLPPKLVGCARGACVTAGAAAAGAGVSTPSPRGTCACCPGLLLPTGWLRVHRNPPTVSGLPA